MASNDPQWHSDPTGLHELRYWDGVAWSAHVSDAGVMSVDPMPVSPEPAVEPVVAQAPPAYDASAVAAEQPVAHEPVVDLALETAGKWARLYADACLSVIAAAQACIEVGNHALQARNAADMRPQHEISIRNFESMATKYEQDFAPVYAAFNDACAHARECAATLIAAQDQHDPELVILTALDADVYGQTSIASHILRAKFGSKPAAFMEGLEQANEAIDADTAGWGQEGFVPVIYSPQAATEKVCPWCAETIKAAAVICRFCSRDVGEVRTSMSPS